MEWNGQPPACSLFRTFMMISGSVVCDTFNFTLARPRSLNYSLRIMSAHDYPTASGSASGRTRWLADIVNLPTDPLVLRSQGFWARARDVGFWHWWMNNHNTRFKLGLILFPWNHSKSVTECYPFIESDCQEQPVKELHSLGSIDSRVQSLEQDK